LALKLGSKNAPIGSGHHPHNDAWFDRAKKVTPGGVNSPVRAFGGVGGTPLVIRSAAGATIIDVDGREYLDFVARGGR
jgi:glutamate-1-semialdehyde 2,1-aminomutase